MFVPYYSCFDWTSRDIVFFSSVFSACVSCPLLLNLPAHAVLHFIPPCFQITVIFSLIQFLSGFLHLIFSNAQPARFLFPIVQSANLFPSHVLSDHPEGGQADGAAGRRWPRLPAPQVCLLPEGHRAHVPVPFPRKDHPVSSQCHSYISTHHFRVAVVSPSD